VCQIRGSDSTEGRISIFLLFFEWPLQQSSATALPVIANDTSELHHNSNKNALFCFRGGTNIAFDLGSAPDSEAEAYDIPLKIP